MSRPQFPVQSQTSSTVGHVVNGGLIDFQDNFNRGVPDFGAMMQHAHPGMVGLSAGLGQSPYYGQLSGFQQPGFQQPSASYQTVAAAMGGMTNQTILGHPSFINVGGKVYKPVEEQAVASSVAAPERKPEPETAAPAHVSDADLDRRVEQRLEEWMSNQRSSSGRTYGRSIKSKCSFDEERAAARVKSLNAGMRYFSPA